MGWIDKQLVFSEDQDLTSSASDIITSTNVLDVGDALKGEGNVIEILAQMTTAATVEITTTATSTIQAKLLTSAYEGMTGTTTLYDTGALAYTEWDAIGDGPNERVLANNAKQYLAWVFTIGAGMDVTAGNIFAALALGSQSN